MRNPLSVTVNPDNGNVYVADRNNHRVAVYQRGVPGWNQLNTSGFGTVNNMYYSLEYFGGKLFAGSNNQDNGGTAELHRLDSSSPTTWSTITDADFNHNIGFKALKTHNGFLYAGVSNRYCQSDCGTPSEVWTSDGGQVLRSASGATDGWSNVTFNYNTLLGNNNYRNEVNNLTSFNGRLYAAVPFSGGIGDTNTGKARILSCQSCDGSDWQLEASFIPADVEAQKGDWVNDFLTAGNVLYAITNQGEMWRSNGSTWAKITGTAFGENRPFFSLGIYKNNLYAGTDCTFVDGVCTTPPSLWMCPSSSDCSAAGSWAKTSLPAISGNFSVSNLKTIGSFLYLVAGGAPSNGIQVWRTDGVTWEKMLADNGFGSNINVFPNTNGVVVDAANKKIVISTFNWDFNKSWQMYGGGIWMSNAFPDPLPIAVADSYKVVLNYTLNVAAPGVLVNDSDVLGKAITAVKTKDPEHGTLSLNADGSFSYTPTPGYTGTSDSFKYAAQNDTGNSPEVTVSIELLPDNVPTKLLPANGFTLKQGASTTKLKWDLPTGKTKKEVKAYTVQVATSPDFSGVLLVNKLVKTTNLTLKNLLPNTAYYWRVQALFTDNTSSSWSNFASPRVLNTLKLKAPRLVAPANNSKQTGTQVKLSWSKPLGTPRTGYQYVLQYGPDSSFAEGTFTEVKGLTKNSATLSIAKNSPTKTIYWRVRVASADGLVDFSETALPRSFIR
jgi:hypothetical protein